MLADEVLAEECVQLGREMTALCTVLERRFEKLLTTKLPTTYADGAADNFHTAKSKSRR